MSIFTPLRARLAGNGQLIAVIPLVLALAGFLGFLTISMLQPAPSADFVDLARKLQEARSGSLSEEQIRTLDQAAATLEAARRMIKLEPGRSWRLRSYDRAQTLLWQAETLVERAEASPPPSDLNPTVPAG